MDKEDVIALLIDQRDSYYRAISDDGPVNDYDAWCYGQAEKFQAAIEWVRGR